MPSEIKLSRHPGFLTSEGGMLFTTDSANKEYLDSIEQDAKISDVAWDGQLFVPIWTFLPRRFYGLVAFLAIWLYLDLPQYITPTPGLAPTLLANRLLDYLVPPSLEESTKESVFSTPIWQWVFFALHVLKIVFIFILFQTGSFNPVSLNPYSHYSSRRKKVDQHMLKSIGWTATRKSTVADWRLENFKNQTKNGDSHSIQISNSSDKLRFSGIYLDKDEGFNVKKNMTLIEREEFEKYKLANPSKFYMSEDYLNMYYTPLAIVFSDPEVSEVTRTEVLSYYRKYGPKKGTTELKAIYEKRERLQNNLIKENKIKAED